MNMEIRKDLTPKSRMVFINKDLMTIESSMKRPNRWWRAWHFMLLGIYWEVL